MNFNDHFTKQSDIYAKFRPGYPDELFEFLASISPSNDTAWDCATGSGQAAKGLVKYFKKIIASDASASQVQNAFRNEKIIYNIFPAEKADIESSSVDLVTVAQALHWFNFEMFYSEVRRVLRKNGVFAAWMYDLVKICPDVDVITQKFDDEILRKYWPPERQLFYEKYRSIPFPFEKIDTPEFEIKADWTIEQLTGFLSTWSAVQKYKEKENSDPLNLIRNDLVRVWGDDRVKSATWKIILVTGKV